ncbi:BQ2448_3239 [Microbotryum intermedium]|uniref:BQ2448_3239 protein n=1 Tax=Microbotryum intermedium TaxID=269621 RepID=A0A238FHN8_9BASI|nr:BQ2448_3239 [Microbotryum intermedium]
MVSVSTVFELAVTPPRPRPHPKKATGSAPVSPLRNGSLNHSNPHPQPSSSSSLTQPSTSPCSPTWKTRSIDENRNANATSSGIGATATTTTATAPVRPTKGIDIGRTTSFAEPSSFSRSTSGGDMSMVEDDHDPQPRDGLHDEDDLGKDGHEDGHPSLDHEGDVEPHTVIDHTERDDQHGSDDDQDESYKPILHVEVRLKPTGSVRTDTLRTMVRQYLLADDPSTMIVEQNSELDSAWARISVLDMYVDRIWVAESEYPHATVPLSEVELEIHIYQPTLSSRTSDCFISTADDDYENEASESDGPAASVLELPSLSLEGIWDNLIYEEPVKENLLNYINSSMEFSDHDVDFNIVSWNRFFSVMLVHRVCLLHGPPGSGKTSLCRALAQKLAIRLSTTYRFGRLIEINSHSLFSKWFSESGKLVQKLFASVTEMVEDEEGFAVVLIDEVESLTAARAGAMSGKEPSDALRVVNALLTQLDKLKTRKNCLVITTSNLSEAIGEYTVTRRTWRPNAKKLIPGTIDPAFIDRADIKQYVGLPPPPAIYWILRSSLLELMSKQMIRTQTLLTYDQLSRTNLPSPPDGTAPSPSHRLFALATACRGMSGRTLRKLPILAHSKFLAKHASRRRGEGKGLKLERWLEAIELVVKEEKRQRALIDGMRE